MTAEHDRLDASEARRADWKKWGPYLAERAWGTVREDYSATGEAWEHFPHDHARSRAYRWNEDGLAGFCDRDQTVCLGLGLWNERDPILKERLFGVTGTQGNHGEDVKEYYYYLNSTPTHSYARMLYKYPQGAYPYADLVHESERRGKDDPEYELDDAPADVQHLARAADQFVVHRPTADDPDGKSIIAGYPWFGDWGRDTMIALSGLTLTTGRPDVAEKILRTYARYVDRGMIPNRFPDRSDTPEYNTVDATLWYVEAIRATVDATGDTALLRDLFPTLRKIVKWHEEGTRYGIQVDPDDGLLWAGEPGMQLTWMDAKVGDWVVTPRIGKPVEVNALRYNALRSLESFAETLGEPADAFAERAEQVEAHFDRFWDAERGHLRDVIDGPDGDDPSLRPNQIFTVSLPHSPLSDAQQQALVDTCAAHLYTPHGLRSLSPEHPDYVGVYQGGREDRDGAYHQGTVWSWLMGPFVKAHLRVHGDPATARSYLVPLRRHLDAHGVGSVSEIFDGDAPFTPQGTPAQAWGVAQVLAGYLGVTWTLFELMQWLTERYLISPYLGRTLLLGLLLLLPSVLVVAYRHGRPGPDRWTSTERWTFVGNGAAAVLVLFVVFGDVELGSMVRTVQTSAADTSGGNPPREGIRQVPKKQFRRHVALFYFDEAEGARADTALRRAAPTALRTDLEQDPFVNVSSRAIRGRASAAGIR